MPLEVTDDEVLIRAVTSWNLKRDNLHFNLFVHPTDSVSVSRFPFVSKWLAKIIAKMRVENPGLKPPKLYVGLALVSASVVRQQSWDVLDTRDEYLGHADIRHGHPLPSTKNEAMPPELKMKIDDGAKKIAASAKFYKDANSNSLF